MLLKETDMPLESEWRNYFHPKKTLTQIIGWKKGMVLVDIGCGFGTFALPAAEIVGNQGHVYAVDIDKNMVETVKRKARHRGLHNLTAIHGDGLHSRQIGGKMVPKSADVVLLANVLHGAPNKVRFLKSVKQFLITDGTIAILNWILAKTPRGPPMELRPGPEETKEFLVRAGLFNPTYGKVPPYHYAVIAQNSNHRTLVHQRADK